MESHNKQFKLHMTGWNMEKIQWLIRLKCKDITKPIQNGIKLLQIAAGTKITSGDEGYQQIDSEHTNPVELQQLP